MNRDEFFAKLAGLDEDRIKKALWNLYWRGPAQLRERIESELDPAQDAVRKRAAAEPPDPGIVLWEVRDFAELARAGAYLAGDRRVSPKERTRWRLTFRRLAGDALAALRHEDSGPEEAVVLLIDLACETKRFDYFRSEDPMEAAQFVVSDAAATLWEFVRSGTGSPGSPRSPQRSCPDESRPTGGPEADGASWPRRRPRSPACSQGRCVLRMRGPRSPTVTLTPWTRSPARRPPSPSPGPRTATWGHRHRPHTCTAVPGRAARA